MGKPPKPKKPAKAMQAKKPTNTFSITGGADAASFTIDSSTGVLTFTSAPDFEIPGDANMDNVYDVQVQVSDGAATDTQSIAVTVTDVNDAPTGANNTVVTAEDTAYTFTLADFPFADQDGDALAQVQIAGLPGNGTLELSGVPVSVNDVILVADITAGNLRFVPPADANGVAYDAFQFRVHDGTVYSAAAYTLTVDVTPVNDLPALAGIEGAALSYTENGAPTAITASLTAADVDDTQLERATVQITGNYVTGEDLLAFTNTASITGTWDAATGTMTLTGTDTLANYQTALRSVTYQNTSENPSTLTRMVSFTVNDGDLNSNTVARTITVTAVNDAPVITSYGGGASGAGSAAENATPVTRITATDVEGNPLTFSIVGGADAGRFALDPATGALRFLAAPDFENPGDANSDNIYEVQVQVSDGAGGTDTQLLRVQVTDDIGEALPPPPVDTTDTTDRAVEEDAAEPAVAPPPDVETTAEPVEAEASDAQETAEAAATPTRRGQNQGPFVARPRGWVETPEESTRTSFTEVPSWFQEVGGTFDPGESASLLEDVKSRDATIPTIFLNKLSAMGQDLERALDDTSSQRDFQVKVMTGSTLVLTAGYLAWVLRGGSLLASLLGTLPAWFHFDPLPILTASKREQRRQKYQDEMAEKQEAREFKGLDQVFGGGEPSGGSRS